MPITRAIVTTGTGAELAADLKDTVNHIFGKHLGRLISVAGTNSITATVETTTGFSGLSNGARAVLIPAAGNTGAVTLNIAGTGAAPVRTSEGDALAAGDLVAGRAIEIEYNSTEGAWRVLGAVASQAAVATAEIPPPYVFVREYLANGTFTAPFDCYVNIWAFGGGGGGAKRASGRIGSGAAGATCIKRDVFLTSGAALSISIGAGGDGPSGAGASNGGNGGATTVSGDGGVNMSAGGGAGGAQADSGTVAGAAGGTATGGDINITGQSSATINTGGFYAPGTIALSTALPAPATNEVPTGLNWFQRSGSIISTLGPFVRSNFPSTGTAAGESGGRGCGGMGDSGDAGEGGAGFVVIEWTTAVA